MFLQGALTPVHFLTPDGTDVIVNPGHYEMNAAGNTLRLQSTDMKDPIHIQAGPAPYPDAVDSPLAMAIPIPDEGMYPALAVPNEPGHEAMGSYSGTPRGDRKLRLHTNCGHASDFFRNALPCAMTKAQEDIT